MIQCRVKEIMQMNIILGEGDVACGSGTVELDSNERLGIITFTDLAENGPIGEKTTEEAKEAEPDVTIMVSDVESLDVLLLHVLRMRSYLLTGKTPEDGDIKEYIKSIPTGED